MLHFFGGAALVRGVTSYWLPNIKASLRSILRFALLFAVTAVLLLGVVLGAEQFAERWPLSHTSLVFVLAIVAALIYLPLYHSLQSLVNRLLERVGFDPTQVLRDYSQTIGTILNLEQLARTAVQTVADVLGVQRGALLVVAETEEENPRLQPVPGLGDVSQEPLKFEPNSPILTHILENDVPLFQYEVEQHPDLQKAAEQGMARNPPGQRFFLLALPPNTVALTKAANGSDVAVRERIAARGAVLMVCQRDIDNGSIVAATLVPGVVPVRGFPPRGSDAIPRGERYYPDEDRATLPRNNNSLKRLRKACT